MIGTGVFTSVGFQLSSVQNTWSILLLWLAGGILALFGAFAYAELGTHFKESGGDYIYLSRVFHPLLGYLISMGRAYSWVFCTGCIGCNGFYKIPCSFWITRIMCGWQLAVIVLIGLMHSFTIRHSSSFQNISTIIKVIIYCMPDHCLGLFIPGNGNNAINFSNSWQHEILKPGFAVSMVYVAFAYTGWNAAAYVVDEIDNPSKNLPKALIGSTLFVASVYMSFSICIIKKCICYSIGGKRRSNFYCF